MRVAGFQERRRSAVAEKKSATAAEAGRGAGIKEVWFD